MQNASFMFFEVDGLEIIDARNFANEATHMAQKRAPRLTGNMAKSLKPFFQAGQFGISWEAKYTLFQEKGIKPFTMNELQGKTIPMWLDDPHGEIKKENPSAKTRVRSGRHQTLIFRHASHKGERKTIVRDGKKISVPRSYPGAPGRIGPNHRYVEPFVPPGRAAGMIRTGNVGVRWRHPGMEAKEFIHGSILEVARNLGLQGKLYIGK